MRIAHVIMAHKGAEQLLRLINRLSHPNFDFYIHVDAKVSLDKFKNVISQSNVFFIQDRKSCNWGGWSFTRAIIGALTEIINGGIEYSFFNLLSAQDYPLMTSAQIFEHFEARKGKNFIYYEDDNSIWWKEASRRYEKYHFTDSNIKGKYLIQKVINFLLPKRKFPDAMKLYGGSNASWWTIDGKCAKYLIERIGERSQLDLFLKYCWGTDEFVITTIIMNSSFKDLSVNENFRYIDWSEGGGHPRFLNTSDYNKIISSGMIFARKFDAEMDDEILDMLDNFVDKKNKLSI